MNVSFAAICLFIGCAIVCLFCFANYKDNIHDTNHPTYYIILTFFCFVNIVFYILLCSLFIKENPTQLVTDIRSIDFDASDYLTILLTAFMYFGVGSATYKFPIMGINFNIYETIFESFKKLIPQPSTDEIEYNLEQFKDIDLCDAISDLRIMSIHKKWNPLNDLWKSTNADTVVFQINCMREIEQKLINQDPQELTNTIQLERAKLTAKITPKLRRFVKEFYVINGKTEQDRREICDVVGLPVGPLKKLNLVVYSIVISFAIGFFVFGPAAAINKHEDIPTYSLIGALSLSILGAFIPKIIKQTQLGWSAGYGFLSGLLAHSTWILLTEIVLNLIKKQVIDFPIWDKLHNIVVGGQIGLALSILLFFFKKNQSSIANYITSLYLRYVLFSLLSGVSFLAIALINYNQLYFNDPNYSNYWISTPLIGIGVGWTVAYISKIFDFSNVK